MFESFSDYTDFWFIQIGLYVTSGQVCSRCNLLESLSNNKRSMEAIIEKANKLLPFGLRAQKLVPFFIGVKLVSFAFFAIFMMNH